MRLTDWHRKLAASIAAAGPAIPMVEIRATGNNLAAQNDEAELHPFRESDFEPADLSEVELQVQLQGFVGGVA